MSDKIVTLVFMNADSTPKNTKIICSQSSVYGIVCWYGSHFSGDRYTVACDGHDIPLNRYGEPLKPLETCSRCSGSGMTLCDNGDPGICPECHGDTVTPGR